MHHLVDVVPIVCELCVSEKRHYYVASYLISSKTSVIRRPDQKLKYEYHCGYGTEALEIKCRTEEF